MATDRPFRHVGEVVLDRYLLDRPLGEGAFAWVYHGRTKAGGEVAVKVLRDTSDEAIHRLAREAHVLRALPPSPHVVRYVAEGKTRQGVPLLVLEHVDGITLRAGIRARGKLLAADAVAFVLALCDALSGLHQLGVAHRDVKPANVLLTPQGGLKLVDFGLVHDSQGILKLLEEEGGHRAAGPLFGLDLDRGMVAGTLAYAAPEQLSDPMGLTADRTGTASDVFSVGVILYELLSGTNPLKRVPEAGESGDPSLRALVAFRLALREDDVPPVPGADPGLQAIVRRAMARDPADRPHDAGALRTVLLRHATTGLADSRGGAPRFAPAPTVPGAPADLGGSTATDLDLGALAREPDGGDNPTDVSGIPRFGAEIETRIGRATAVFFGVGSEITAIERPTTGSAMPPKVVGAGEREAGELEMPDEQETSTWTPAGGTRRE